MILWLLKTGCTSVFIFRLRSFFHQECERLKEIFTRLHYPEPLIQNTIRRFVEMKVTGSKRPLQQAGEIPVRIPLPFKDQRSANKLREQLFTVFLILFTSFLYFIFAFPYFYCSYVNTCFLLFIPLFQKLHICGIVLSMNLNLKMTVERSKRRSYFLTFILWC